VFPMRALEWSCRSKRRTMPLRFPRLPVPATLRRQLLFRGCRLRHARKKPISFTRIGRGGNRCNGSAQPFWSSLRNLLRGSLEIQRCLRLAICGSTSRC